VCLVHAGAWEQLRELAADRDALDDTFDEWERGALAVIRELTAAGRSVRKIPRRGSTRSLVPAAGAATR